ncbi:MAG: DUF29 domain-containing protein [Pseudanabaenaceae cyanobacterium SKYGB_i_bin29]|nr:DUF29 domain-containing protein [Pseudanabaenaceae cyanobacterium SKYG29]MDW8422620.1 DUF29 domain-containing protein [Pseudanabaenaceae cyanobacterium SKYGB_i_bin29]
MNQSLHDRDFLLWVEDTVARLKKRDFDNLDLEHLIEEVEGLGIAQRHELSSRLLILLEHLLKRMFVPSPNDYRGWEVTINNQRSSIDLLLEEVPSLKTLWPEIFEKAWTKALKKVSREYKQIAFPDRWLYAADIESILNIDFWEEQS